jgi:disulfide bond formation protein DsbB
MPQSVPVPSKLGLLAFAGSSALLGGAYYFQYVQGLAPCDLCLLQRYPHMVAVAAGLAALACLRSPRLSLIFVVVAIIALFVTSGIGAFHVGVEQHWWQGPQECSGRIPSGLTLEQLKKYLYSAKMVRCDEAVWKLMDISMAGWNAIISAALAIFMVSSVSTHLRTAS